MIEGKKILVIAGGTYIYGAEKVTLEVIKGLSNNGYEVQAIISGWSDGMFGKMLDELKIKYYKIKLGWYYISKILWTLDSLVHYPGAVFRFLRIKKHFKDWPVYIISFRQVILLWPFFKKNIIYHVHDVNSNSRLSRFFLKIIDKKVIKYIAVSAFIKNDLIKCGIAADKIEIIHNGVELKPVSVSLPEITDNLTIGIVGQLIPRKGHIDVIEAMKILAEQGIDNIVLKIIGDGPIEYKLYLETLAKQYKLDKQIAFLGLLKTSEEMYGGVDIVIVPTRNDEPFALVPLEANAMSKLVIVTNKGGFPEMVKDGYNGFIVESTNAGQLAEKIALLLNVKPLQLEMGKNGRSIVEKYFTKEIMNNKVKSLIDNI